MPIHFWCTATSCTNSSALYPASTSLQNLHVKCTGHLSWNVLHSTTRWMCARESQLRIRTWFRFPQIHMYFASRRTDFQNSLVHRARGCTTISYVNRWEHLHCTHCCKYNSVQGHMWSPHCWQLHGWKTISGNVALQRVEVGRSHMYMRSRKVFVRFLHLLWLRMLDWCFDPSLAKLRFSGLREKTWSITEMGLDKRQLFPWALHSVATFYTTASAGPLMLCGTALTTHQSHGYIPGC